MTVFSENVTKMSSSERQNHTHADMSLRYGQHPLQLPNRKQTYKNSMNFHARKGFISSPYG